MTNSEETIAKLVEEVRYLRDRQDVLDCVNLYGRGLDRLDEGILRRTFHADGIDNHGPFIGTVDEFVPWAIEVESTFDVTHHGVSSHNCEIDGDTAHAESYIHFFVKMPNADTIGAGGGRYLDRLERRDGIWALTVRRFILDWSFEVPASSWLGTEWEAYPPRRDRLDISYQRPLEVPTK
ncbi:nuclear transport factor 2 family protein [Sphingobium nicotianae]|uniref:Nuclear transport factor 2 family protein n=1 Tax=Sphingobium nicotianae TaxID=2782607 RepID=A0A9X1D9Y1_9SPHN|nr:nuclear transport factor 2 family protein [Sphingobium nicotianae]MBT2186066.1 nuclear transport factor 2 family protein [Sphingobium nicotianae]